MAKEEKALAVQGGLARVKLLKSTPQDELCMQLEKFKVNGLTAKEKEKVDEHEELFAEAFVELASRYTGASKNQLGRLKDKHLQTLFAMMTPKVAVRSYLVHVGVYAPSAVFGLVALMAGDASIVLAGSFLALLWFVIGSAVAFDKDKYFGFQVVKYPHYLKALQKARGKKYFPAKAIKRQLREWQ